MKYPNIQTSLGRIQPYGKSEYSDGEVKLNPLHAEYIVFSGSSLTAQATSNDKEKARITDVIKHLGFKAKEFINVGVGGNTIAENRDHWINSVRGNYYTGEKTLCVMVTNGNDVSNNRPYDTDNTSNTGVLSQLSDDWQSRYDETSADVGLVIPTATTLRLYSGDPAVDPQDLENTKQNGSYPYNQNIFLPLIKTNCPEFMNGNKTVVDGYEFVEDRPWIVGANDNVHLYWPDQSAFLEYQLLRIKQHYSTNRADVSGKTVIIYVQSDSDYLEEDPGKNPIRTIATKLVDTDNNHIPDLHAIISGGEKPTNGGSPTADSRVEDTDLHGEPLKNLFYASSGTNLFGYRRNYVTLTIEGLVPGQTGEITIASARDGSSSTSRIGEISIDGVNVGLLDSADDVISNQLGPIPFTVNSSGTMEITSIPSVNNSYSYFSVAKLKFD